MCIWWIGLALLLVTVSLEPCYIIMYTVYTMIDNLSIVKSVQFITFLLSVQRTRKEKQKERTTTNEKNHIISSYIIQYNHTIINFDQKNAGKKKRQHVNYSILHNNNNIIVFRVGLMVIVIVISIHVEHLTHCKKLLHKKMTTKQ